MSKSNIQTKIADVYISMLMKNVDDLSLKNISKKAKIKYEEAVTNFPYDNNINTIKFMKIFFTNLDQRVLDNFFKEIKDEEISLYEKILEGFILRFEELIKYEKAIKTLSNNFQKKLLNFKVLFLDNHLFMYKLLKLSGDKDNSLKLTAKAILLNSLFFKFLVKLIDSEVFDLDSFTRNIDNDLKNLFDAKFLFNY